LRLFHKALRDSCKRSVTLQTFLNDENARAAIGSRLQPGRFQEGWTRIDPGEYFQLITGLVSTSRSQLLSLIAEVITRLLPIGALIVATVESQLLLELDHKDAPVFTRAIRSPIEAAVAAAFESFPLVLNVGSGSDWETAASTPDESELLPEWIKLVGIAFAGSREDYRPPGSIMPASKFDPKRLRELLADAAVIASEPARRAEAVLLNVSGIARGRARARFERVEPINYQLGRSRRVLEAF
jgi:hypothetical protein